MKLKKILLTIMPTEGQFRNWTRKEIIKRGKYVRK